MPVQYHRTGGNQRSSALESLTRPSFSKNLPGRFRNHFPRYDVGFQRVGKHHGTIANKINRPGKTLADKVYPMNGTAREPDAGYASGSDIQPPRDVGTGLLRLQGAKMRPDGDPLS